MTIDEAIEHAEWCADNSCGECAEEHRQLAEWLRELKELREVVAVRDDAKWATVYENAKLRDLVRKMRYGATWTREAREYIETQMRELGIEVGNE